jgi:hypothetical protein
MISSCKRNLLSRDPYARAIDFLLLRLPNTGCGGDAASSRTMRASWLTARRRSASDHFRPIRPILPASSCSLRLERGPEAGRDRQKGALRSAALQRVGKIQDDFAHPTVSSLHEVQKVQKGCRAIDFLHFLQFGQPVRAAAIRSDWPAPPASRLRGYSAWGPQRRADHRQQAPLPCPNHLEPRARPDAGWPPATFFPASLKAGCAWSPRLRTKPLLRTIGASVARFRGTAR